VVLFVGHSRPWCSENAGASIRYLESGDFIGRLCFLLGRSVPCRRRPAGDGAPSGPPVARVAHASLRSSDKRHRVTLRHAARGDCTSSKTARPRKRFKTGKHHVIRAGRSLCSSAAAGAYTNEGVRECLHLNRARWKSLYPDGRLEACRPKLCRQSDIQGPMLCRK